jgi:hypothetical protein
MMRVGFSRALVAASLLFCASFAAQADAPAAIPVGIVWWPADPTDAMHAMGSDTEDCLTARIREVAPEIVVTRQRAIRDALFPLLEPATQPATEADFAALLAREDVRARLVHRGLQYLVVFTGGTRKDKPGGYILCGGGFGAGGCLGFSWQANHRARCRALVARRRHRARTRVLQGRRKFCDAAFVLPVPIPGRTQADACHELGSRIASRSGRLPPDTPGTGGTSVARQRGEANSSASAFSVQRQACHGFGRHRWISA